MRPGEFLTALATAGRKGKAILYVLAGVVLVAVLVGVCLKWSNRKADEARRALGRGITIATTPIATAAPAPGAQPVPTYSTEQERAQKAIAEFRESCCQIRRSLQDSGRYFIATNLLYIDREKGMNELAEVSK